MDSKDPVDSKTILTLLQAISSGQKLGISIAQNLKVNGSIIDPNSDEKATLDDY